MTFKLPVRTVAAFCIAACSLRADVYIDLKNGTIFEIPLSSLLPVVTDNGTGILNTSYATVRLQKSVNCTSTPWEARVDMNFNPGKQNTPPVNRLSVTVEYESDPTGWTTHLGDDPTNDGFGGGIGLKGAAEVQIYNDLLTVYSTGIAPGVVDKLLTSKLRIHEGALHMNLMDQYFSYGNPATVIQSKVLKQLFSITDIGGDQKVYAGFNRVIRDGADRKGCGAKKVILAFEQ